MTDAASSHADLVRLLSRVDQAGTRRELAGFPAWSQEGGSAGYAHFVDVAALDDEPRLAWRRSWTEGRFLVLASPLGIVATDAGRLDIVDPRSGETRTTLPGGKVWALSGDTVAAARRASDGRWEVAFHDLWTGGARTTIPLAAEPWHIGITQRLLLVGVETSLTAYALDNERERATLTWTRAIEDRRQHWSSRYLATATLVLVQDASRVVALDPQTGETRWTRDECQLKRADASGVAVRPLSSSGYDLLGVDGSLLLSDPRASWADALAPGFIVSLAMGHHPYRDEDPYSLSFLDRQSKEKTDFWEAECRRGPLVAAARDVVYVEYDNDTVLAHGLGRGRMWRIDIERVCGTGRVCDATTAGRRHGEIWGLVPMPRGLLVVAQHGLICLSHR